MYTIKKLSRITLLFLLFNALGPASGQLWARPMPGPGPAPGSGHHRQGPVHPDLPLGYLTLRVAGAIFYYLDGNYYRKVPEGGYVLVNPPAGAVIATLPPGYVTVIVRGSTYYLYNDVYYQRIQSRYVVVDPPQQVIVEVPIETGGAVSVTANQLNVRSGPTIGHPVIDKVRQGDILKIKGRAPGWYYIQMPNDNFGWVMKKFTVELASPTEG